MGISKSQTPNGDLLEIETFYGVPSGAPTNNKGIIFALNGGVITIYAWDGSNWIAQ